MWLLHLFQASTYLKFVFTFMCLFLVWLIGLIILRVSVRYCTSMIHSIFSFSLIMSFLNCELNPEILLFPVHLLMPATCDGDPWVCCCRFSSSRRKSCWVSYAWNRAWNSLWVNPAAILHGIGVVCSTGVTYGGCEDRIYCDVSLFTGYLGVPAVFCD